MSPEQASGHTREVTPAADVYAIGAVPYRLLTSRTPFQGSTDLETIQMVIEGALAPGSARALVTVQDKDIQLRLARKIASEELSARKAEALVKRTLSHIPKETSPKEISPFVEAVREDLQRILGTGIKIKGDETKGKIEIEYFSKDDLERILETLKGGPLE